MTKIWTGLRGLVCLLPAEAADHGGGGGEGGGGDAAEQPGTSYTSSEANSFSSYKERNRKGTRGRDKVNCSSGGAQMLACFRAGAINLIVHPAMAMGGQRQGASAVQPVTSLPRAAFLDGAEDHDSGDDPSSPVVTCIGQVRKDKPNKSSPKNYAEVADLWSLRGKPLMNAMESTPTLSSPRPSKWKQILGARGTVNPSQQTRSEESESGEFHIDLNRFGSACSSIPDQGITPSFGNMNGGRTFPAGKFLAKPLTTVQTMQTESVEARNVSYMGVSKGEPALGSLPVQISNSKPRASEEVLLWKRRSGACKPLTLELKRRILESDFR